MNIKELREKRAEQAKEIRRLADLLTGDKKDFTAEERAAWDKVNDEYNANSRQLEIAERADKVKTEMEARREERAGIPGRDDQNSDESRSHQNGNAGRDSTAAATEEDRSLAIQAWFREQCGEVLEDRHEEACRRLAFNPRRRQLDIELMPTHRHQRFARAYREAPTGRAEERALSAVTGSAGGTTVSPGTLVNSLELAMLQFGGVAQVAETIRTTSGEPMIWPTANDTSNSGRQLGESAAVTTLDPTFGAVTWSAYKFTSDEIKVPTELLEDSAIDLPSVIGAMLGERLGRIQNTKYTTGTGAATPYGIVTASALGKTTASATAIVADELFDLVHSIDPAYRTAGFGWMMHDNILLALRKLKDGNGQYLWQSGMQEAAPDRLLSYPITINQDMQSSIATATKTILVGLFNKYKIRQVNAIRLYRLVERHRENDQDAFLAFIRADGNLLNAGVAPVKHMLQA